ncbi:melanocortin receptor 4-like [Antedon mediterranea]|uniref:melanocortin receptor 4-like n=1 Tax=Antedon mediterranea TaxID=105859 RepID=UPI003AF4F86F
MNDSAVNCDYTLKDILLFTFKTEERYLYCVVITYVLSILSLLLNIYMVYTFATEQTLHKRHYLFTVSLAITDAIFALTSLVSVSVGQSVGQTGTLILSVVRTSSVMASFQTLEGIAVERLFVIVLYPLDKNINSPKRILSGIAVIWGVSAVVAGCLHFINEFDILSVIVPIWNLTILIVVTITYAVIYRAIFKHEKKISAHRSQELQLSKKLLKTFSIIICTCTVCWLPADILSIVDLILKDDYCTYDYFVDVHAMEYNLALAYSFINPLVYGLGILELRTLNKKRMESMCSGCRQ